MMLEFYHQLCVGFHRPRKKDRVIRSQPNIAVPARLMIPASTMTMTPPFGCGVAVSFVNKCMIAPVVLTVSIYQT